MKLTSSNLSMNEALNNMDYPEYHFIFTKEGEFIVDVKFEKDSAEPIKRSVPSCRASIADIAKLLEQLSITQSYINIDEHPCLVKNIQIDPVLKTIRLNVRLTEGHDE